jgi:hypothetical protein
MTKTVKELYEIDVEVFRDTATYIFNSGADSTAAAYLAYDMVADYLYNSTKDIPADKAYRMFLENKSTIIVDTIAPSIRDEVQNKIGEFFADNEA